MASVQRLQPYIYDPESEQENELNSTYFYILCFSAINLLILIFFSILYQNNSKKSDYATHCRSNIYSIHELDITVIARVVVFHTLKT